jgi:carbon starvation protein
VIVIAAAVVETIKAKQQGGGVNTEDPYVDSKFFAPQGIISSPAEKALEAQWKNVAPEQNVHRGGH